MLMFMMQPIASHKARCCCFCMIALLLRLLPLLLPPLPL
jgi:hypothetical protein